MSCDRSAFFYFGGIEVTGIMAYRSSCFLSAELGREVFVEKGLLVLVVFWIHIMIAK